MRQPSALTNGWCGQLSIPWFLVAVHAATLFQPQVVRCDTDLVRRGAPFVDYGYRPRIGRCEGIFGKSVNAPLEPVALIGLVESYEPYDLNAPHDIRLSWDAPAGDSIFISATARRPLLFYRMDAGFQATDTAFRWPFNVLRARRIENRNIAVLARTRLLVKGLRSEAYLPIRLGHLSAPRRTGTYRMVVLPNVRLLDLSVSVASLTSDGDVATAHPLREIPQKPFEAETGVDIALPEITAPGLFRVSIGGTLSNGAPTNRQWLVVVPERKISP